MALLLSYVSLTTTDIFLMGDRLQMSRVHTGRHSTQMVEVKTCRNDSDQHFVGKSVSVTESFVVPEDTVPERCLGTLPNPTILTLGNSSPEALFIADRIMTRPIAPTKQGKRIAVLLPALPMQSAPTSCPGWPITSFDRTGGGDGSY